jgi:predicted aspartyl protease
LLTYPYDIDNYEVPALVVEAKLVHPNPRDKRYVTKMALIDTGADGSTIPARIKDEWNLIKADDVKTIDCHFNETTEPSYDVRIVVNGFVSKIVDVTLVDEDEVILGRDILNEMKMCANGKALLFTLEKP